MQLSLWMQSLRGKLLACLELEVLPIGPQTTDLVIISFCGKAVVITGPTDVFSSSPTLILNDFGFSMDA